MKVELKKTKLEKANLVREVNKMSRTIQGLTQENEVLSASLQRQKKLNLEQCHKSFDRFVDDMGQILECIKTSDGDAKIEVEIKAQNSNLAKQCRQLQEVNERLKSENTRLNAEHASLQDQLEEEREELSRGSLQFS